MLARVVSACGIAMVETAAFRPAGVVPYHGEVPPTGERMIAAEVAVNVVFATVPFAVMMMTPGDLEDFAYGFSLTEGVIGAAADVRGVRVSEAEGGLVLDVELVPGRLSAHLARRRTLTGRTGCGVCGVEALADLPFTGVRAGAGPEVSARAVRRALDGMEALQTLNRATGAVHAAGFAEADGRVVLVREDVGRHNALDKLIGAAMRAGVDARSGFVVVTSRCSFEMVEKTAAFGAGMLVAISAPTGLAIDRAGVHGMVLVGLARRDSMTVFSGNPWGAETGAEMVSA